MNTTGALRQGANGEEFIVLGGTTDNSGNDVGGVKLTDFNEYQSFFLEWVGTAGAADNAVIYTSPIVTSYNQHTFTVSGTNAADVEVSHDGTTWDVAAVELTDDVTTGGGIKVVTIPTGKTGVLRGKFKYVRINQDGATDSDAVGAHSVI